ncbi:MAG: 50S ribosomal protein L9 [Rhodospirillales bacterium]|nr:MAG: 50S ribosomal protein L9 [Rhodospirillales bacterium]
MDVILLERVAKLGRMGEVVKVRPGYARNYLLPQKKAVRATEANRQRFEAERTQLEAVNQEHRAQAESLAGGLEHLTVVLIRQAGESGQLYGSVQPRDIAEAASQASGLTIHRRQVLLSQPIKSLGLYPVPIGLHPEVVVDVTVNVARSPDEAEIQARSGRAVTGIGDEREASMAPMLDADVDEAAAFAPADEAAELGGQDELDLPEGRSA